MKNTWKKIDKQNFITMLDCVNALKKKKLLYKSLDRKYCNKL